MYRYTGYRRERQRAKSFPLPNSSAQSKCLSQLNTSPELRVDSRKQPLRFPNSTTGPTFHNDSDSNTAPELHVDSRKHPLRFPKCTTGPSYHNDSDSNTAPELRVDSRKQPLRFSNGTQPVQARAPQLSNKDNNTFLNLKNPNSAKD